MPIIKTHDTTLQSDDMVLKPLCDEHLPLLYQWNSDIELLYWTEGADVSAPYDKDTIQAIYGGVSQNAFCFLIEVNGVPIGDCWLQKMNLPAVIEKYPTGLDIRRIDMAIGEKNYWNRGYGTRLVKMLVDFAFTVEKVELLHCMNESYNIRSQRVFEKNGFHLAYKAKRTNSMKSEYELHYELSREDYLKQTKKTE